jgi:hypothetical protein
MRRDARASPIELGSCRLPLQPTRLIASSLASSRNVDVSAEIPLVWMRADYSRVAVGILRMDRVLMVRAERHPPAVVVLRSLYFRLHL